MPRLLRRIFPLLLFAFLPVFAAHAQLTIEIVGGAGTTIPIAIVPFANENTYPLGITGIVGADLTRSGLFRLVDYNGVSPRPTRAEEIQPAVWRSRNADAVVAGSMRPLGDGRVEVRFSLVDVVKQVPLATMTYTVTPQQFRVTAHKIADVIYEKLTGDPGIFSTRIAYITKQGPRFQLLVADADGADPQTIVTSNEPLLSPKWSPDGTRLAYVSFENKKPVVYVQSLSTGQRVAVANFRGSNSFAGLVAGRTSSRGHAHQGRQLADLSRECRRRQRGATPHVVGHRHGSRLYAGRRVACVHVRPWRLAADLSCEHQWRKRRATHVRRRLQRVAAADARRQGARVRAPRLEPLPGCIDGLRDAPGAGPDRRAR
jgi:hypothetical protein